MGIKKNTNIVCRNKQKKREISLMNVPPVHTQASWLDVKLHPEKITSSVMLLKSYDVYLKNRKQGQLRNAKTRSLGMMAGE